MFSTCFLGYNLEYNWHTILVFLRVSLYPTVFQRIPIGRFKAVLVHVVGVRLAHEINRLAYKLAYNFFYRWVQLVSVIQNLSPVSTSGAY